MIISLSSFRAQMFKLFAKIDKGEAITLTHKNHKYVILPEEKARKLRLLEALSDLPKFRIRRDEIKAAIQEGRR